MKIAHLAVITPRRCGLYETTRELVDELRALKIDSRIVDPLPLKNPVGWKGTEDRGALIANLDWARQADILVNHSGLGQLENTSIPVIHVAHGRPRHSFLNEVNGLTPIYSYHFTNNYKDQFKAIVTFWKQHKPYLEVMYPNKPVYYIPSPVDLDFWKPMPTRYDFANIGGDINIVCTDAFRDDIDCYEPINAFALFARQYKKETNKTAKLHIYGKPNNMKGWGALIKRVQEDGNMGIIQGWAKELQHVYRAADLVMTAHEIDVRTVREAMACGCPVLRIKNIECYSEILNSINKNRSDVRKEAEVLFNPKETAKQFVEVLNAVYQTKCYA